jgi:hypothetical protein
MNRESAADRCRRRLGLPKYVATQWNSLFQVSQVEAGKTGYGGGAAELRAVEIDVDPALTLVLPTPSRV